VTHIESEILEIRHLYFDAQFFGYRGISIIDASCNAPTISLSGKGDTPAPSLRSRPALMWRNGEEMGFGAEICRVSRMTSPLALAAHDPALSSESCGW
jgi:hypothetical protein